MKTDHNRARLLAYVTGLVNQELLLQNEYLAAENRILRAQQPSRLRRSNPERATLAEFGKKSGPQSPGAKSRASLNRTPFWAGTGEWLPRSSTGPNAPGSLGAVKSGRSNPIGG
jgi:hypothetical protein